MLCAVFSNESWRCSPSDIAARPRDFVLSPSFVGTNHNGKFVLRRPITYQRCLSAFSLLAVAGIVAASDTRQLFPEGHAKGMFYLLVVKPLAIGNLTGAGLGFFTNRFFSVTAFGIAVGLVWIAFTI